MHFRALFACLVVVLLVARAPGGQSEALPSGAVRRLGTAHLRHPGVAEVHFVHGGKALVSAGGDGTVRLWETSSGRELGRFAGSTFCLSPDEKRLATADGAVRVWELNTGKELACSPLHRGSPPPAPCQLALTHDGRALVVFEPAPSTDGRAGGRVRTWDLGTGKLTREWTIDPGHNYVMLSPDGNTIIQNDGGAGFKLHDAATGKRLRDWPFTLYSRSVFAPDGQTVVGLTFGPNEDVSTGGTLVGRDIRTGKDRFRVRTTSNLWAWFFSPDGKKLVTGPGLHGTYSAVAPEKHALHVIDTATGTVLHELPVGDNGYQGVVFSGDGKRLAVSGWAGGGIRIWDLDTGKRIRAIPCTIAQHSSFDLTHDGRVLALGVGPCVHLWDTTTGKRLLPQRAHELAPVALGFSADGKRLASIDASAAAHVWDTRTGVHLQRFAPPPPGDEHHYYPFAAPTLIFTPGGKVHAVGQSGKVWSRSDGPFSHSMVHEVDLATGARVRCYGSHQTPIGSFAVSADGKTFAGTIGDRLHLWDLDTGRQRAAFVWRQAVAKEQLDRPGWQSAPALALAPDGRSVATGTFRMAANSKGVSALTLWETATGKVRHRVGEEIALPSGTSGGTGIALLVAPDGRTLVLGHGDTLCLWDMVDRREVRRFGGRMHAATAALSPVGRLLAALGEDGGIALWDVATGTALPPIKLASRLTCFRFAPDGRTLATGGEDTAVLLWDLARLTVPRPAVVSDAGFETLWSELAGADAARAGRAMAALARGGADSVARIRQRLRPVAPANPERLRRLLADLDNDDFTVRDRARRDLEALGDLALAVLARHDDDRLTLEARRRVSALRDKLTAAPPTAEALRALRAIETLERIGSAEARDLLEALAAGAPEHRVTVAAREASTRLRLRLCR